MLEFSDELASEGVMLVDKVIVSTLSNVVHQFSGTVEQVLNGMIVQGYSNFYISKCMDLREGVELSRVTVAELCEIAKP